MSSTIDRTTVSLGEVQNAGSRHSGRRSTVSVGDDVIAVGKADGSLTAHETGSLATRWEETEAASIVSSAVFDGDIAVGERGPDGEIRLHDAETGAVSWRVRTADDVGEAQRETRFYYPFVVDLVAAADGSEELLYAAARRYERDDDARNFTSVVYAFEPDGNCRWRYETDASPISIDHRDDRVAVGYNRCPGSHQRGLVVLDAATGEERLTWDPGNDGQRRVGDVSLLADGLAVTSHGDYYGYVLDDEGAVRWRADLATPVDRGDETLYAYPNHVHATADGVAFLTGNTYPEEGRETESRHADEHTLFGYSPDGERQWSASVGGFVPELGTDGNALVAPGAQNFRTRDPETHGIRVFDVADGPQFSVETDGIATAASVDGGVLTAIEEPVEYHDENRTRGSYRLHVVRIGD